MMNSKLRQLLKEHWEYMFQFLKDGTKANDFWGDEDLTDVANKALETGKEIIAFGLSDESIAVYINLAMLEQYFSRKSYSQQNIHLSNAMDYCASVLNHDPSNSMALYNAAMIQIHMQHFDEAAKYIERIASDYFDKDERDACFGLLRDANMIISLMDEPESIRDQVMLFLDTLQRKVRENIKEYTTAILKSAEIYKYRYSDYSMAYATLREALKYKDESEDLVYVYYMLCSLCIDIGDLDLSGDKFREAKAYGDLAYKYVNSINKEDKAMFLANYGLALCYCDDATGLNKCWMAVTMEPSDGTYGIYGLAYNALQRYEEALPWMRKAIFIHEFSLNLKNLADTYRELGNYKEAIGLYDKAIGFCNVENEDRFHNYTDVDGREITHSTSKQVLSYLHKKALLGLIQSYLKLSDHKKAYSYLQVAKALFPNDRDFKPVEDSFETILQLAGKLDECKQISEEEIGKLKEELLSARQEIDEQKRMSKELALRLIRLQESSETKDLDNLSDWKDYEKEINRIIDELERKARENKELLAEIEKKCNEKFSFLSDKELHCLITAELLYQLHKNNQIDFACIVLEYCKVLEMLLRRVMGNKIPPDIKMLGEIVYLIRNEQISPYNRYLRELTKINHYRRDSAHTGALEKQHADAMRQYYFDQKLLNHLDDKQDRK